jgi:hypothetical protein
MISQRMPSASIDLRALPPWLLTVCSMSAVPKPRPIGALIGGPPLSLQSRQSESPLTIQPIETAPSGLPRAPYLTEFVPSSCNIMAVCRAVCGSSRSGGPEAVTRLSSTAPGKSWSRMISRKSAPSQPVAVSSVCIRDIDCRRPLKLSAKAAGSLALRKVCCAIA